MRGEQGTAWTGKPGVLENQGPPIARGGVRWTGTLIFILWTQQVLYISPTGSYKYCYSLCCETIGKYNIKVTKGGIWWVRTVVRNEHGTSRRIPKIWILILKAIVPPLTPESHTLFRFQYILSKLDKIILLALFYFIFFSFLNSSKGIWLWRKLYQTGPNGALSYLLSWPKMM